MHNIHHLLISLHLILFTIPLMLWVSNVDLLPVFDAVYRSRSVRLAAEELAMSTSALSHALSRMAQRRGAHRQLFRRQAHRAGAIDRVKDRQQVEVNPAQDPAVLSRRPPDVSQRLCQPAGALYRFGAEISQSGGRCAAGKAHGSAPRCSSPALPPPGAPSGSDRPRELSAMKSANDEYYASSPAPD
jgi:hypothetical protein